MMLGYLIANRILPALLFLLPLGNRLGRSFGAACTTLQLHYSRMLLRMYVDKMLEVSTAMSLHSTFRKVSLSHTEATHMA